MRTRARRGRLVAVLLAAAPFLLAGCRKTQNTLAPESHQSKDIASLFWWMMGGAWIGLALVVGLLLFAWRRSNRRGAGRDVAGPKPGERTGWIVVVALGIVLPLILLCTVFVISDLFVIKTTEAPAASSTKRTILVIGHQWWWEVRYPGTNAVTANELHIPVRTPIRLEVRTADVIHSFWVPQLNRKIDTLPGRTNSIELYADAAGRYRGQCAEFCGLQHAHMAMYVFADSPDRFRQWLANESRPAAAPTSALAHAGLHTFLDGACSSCHAIRGTSADAKVGPDLTHVGSRTTLGAVTIPNEQESLSRWIVDSQHFKPGNEMPNLNLGGPELQGLVAYLRGLK